MWNTALKFIDWFVPEAAKRERSELGLARNFVFTHLFGPALAQSISIFLYLTDPDPGFACWTIILSIWSFWLLPFVLRWTKNLHLVAVISVQVLAFASLFGSYFYGGVSSPFLPWILVALLLGFFYLSDRPWKVIAIFGANMTVFFAAYALNGQFPERVPLSALSTVGLVSIMSAGVYMAWMAIYYVSMIALRSDLEREAERHRRTGVRLRDAKDAAERANKTKSIFLAKMSHELRTPLNAVIGYSELLLEDEEALGGRGDRLADLKRINAAGRHLLALVTDVLDLSRIESNTIELNARSFDLSIFLDDVAATIQPLVGQNRNTLVVERVGALGFISTDETKLRQALLNLLGNAAKFTSDGLITLTARRDPQTDDWFEVEVKDTGIGIAESDLPKLFQDFAQATAATANTYGGTGLGLALSQKLCALMGGGVSVTSAPGKGSTFVVRLPARLAAQAPAVSEPAPVPTALAA